MALSKRAGRRRAPWPARPPTASRPAAAIALTLTNSRRRIRLLRRGR